MPCPANWGRKFFQERLKRLVADNEIVFEFPEFFLLVRGALRHITKLLGAGAERDKAVADPGIAPRPFRLFGSQVGAAGRGGIAAHQLTVFLLFSKLRISSASGKRPSIISSSANAR